MGEGGCFPVSGEKGRKQGEEDCKGGVGGEEGVGTVIGIKMNKRITEKMNLNLASCF